MQLEAVVSSHTIAVLRWQQVHEILNYIHCVLGVKWLKSKHDQLNYFGTDVKKAVRFISRVFTSSYCDLSAAGQFSLVLRSSDIFLCISLQPFQNSVCFNYGIVTQFPQLRAKK